MHNLDYRTFPDIPINTPSTSAMVLTGLASILICSLISYNVGKWETEKIKNTYKKLKR
jgi:hypothetical protein